MATHFENHADMLTTSCNFLKEVMGGHLPIHIANQGGTLTISCNFFVDMVGTCLPVNITNIGNMHFQCFLPEMAPARREKDAGSRPAASDRPWLRHR